MDQKFMKEKPILPLVISMALPMVISMAINSLYNIVDSFFVAQISENAMTALSLVYPLQNLMTAIAVGFGIGINARIAYCLGAGEKKRANQAATTGMLLSFIHGVIVMAVCMIQVPHFLALYTKDKEIIELGLIYAYRIFLFSIIIMLGISLEKIFQSVGRMKVSMCSMVCGFITNIVLDPCMIFGIGFFPEMGMAGAAYATGIGQTVTLLVYLLFCVFRPLPLCFSRKNISFQWDLVRRLYAVGIPASLNMALPSLMISVLNRILTSFSAISVTCCGALEALEKGMASLIISLLRYVVVMIPAAFFLSGVIGAEGVFWAFPLTEAVAAIVAIILYKTSLRTIAG